MGPLRLISAFASEQAACIKLELFINHLSGHPRQQFVADDAQWRAAAAASQAVISAVGGNALDFDTYPSIGAAYLIQDLTHRWQMLLADHGISTHIRLSSRRPSSSWPR